jgi:hypothetical protein
MLLKSKHSTGTGTGSSVLLLKLEKVSGQELPIKL